MRNLSLDEFTAALARATPAPAGGAAAAVTGAIAASLAAMVGRIALARNPGDVSLEQLVEAAEHLRGRLLELAEEDARAYQAVLDAKRDRTGGEQEQEARIRAAWRKAAQVPAEVVKLAREVASVGRRAARGAPASAAPDAVMATLLAAAAAAGSQLNLRANVQAAGRPEDLRVLADQTEIPLRETQRAAAEARLALEEKFGTSRARAPGPNPGA